MVRLEKSKNRFCKRGDKAGFSLVEVLLAVSIFTISMLALLGLLIPTIGSIETVVQKNGATSLVSKVDRFLRGDDILIENPRYETSFDAFYDLVPKQTDEAFSFIAYTTQEDIEDITDREDKIASDPNSDDYLLNDPDQIDGLEGPVYRVFVRASPDYVGLDFDGNKITSFPNDPESYPEGFLTLHVSVFILPRPIPGSGTGGGLTADQKDFYTMDYDEFVVDEQQQPLLEYVTAITR